MDRVRSTCKRSKNCNLDWIRFRGRVATVKRLRIHTIALCLRTGALTVEYFRAHGFYEWLAISTGSYWSSKELKTLLGDLGRNWCAVTQRAGDPRLIRERHQSRSHYWPHLPFYSYLGICRRCRAST